MDTLLELSYQDMLVVDASSGSKKIWVSDKENDSYYHIWDNRVLPSFITEKDGDFATTMFSYPSIVCNEQNLNSVIMKPAQGEKIELSGARKGKIYRIEGYVYDGGGCEVHRVDVSLDGGKTWLYCIRKVQARLEPLLIETDETAFATVSGGPYPTRQEVLDVAALACQC